MVPRWLPAFTFAKGPDGAEVDEVRLVDLTGDGKVDYLLVDEKTGKVTLWENLGTGGKYKPGEGVFLCDCEHYISFFEGVDPNPLVSQWMATVQAITSGLITTAEAGAN